MVKKARSITMVRNLLSRLISFVIAILLIQLVSAIPFSLTYSTSSYNCDSANPDQLFDNNLNNYFEVWTGSGTSGVCYGWSEGTTFLPGIPEYSASALDLRYWAQSGDTYTWSAHLQAYNYTSSTWVRLNSESGSGSSCGSGTYSCHLYGPIYESMIDQSNNFSMRIRAYGNFTGTNNIDEGVALVEITELSTLKFCEPPTSGDWLLKNGLKCTLNSAKTITGNLNISESASLEIQGSGALTISGGYVYIYPGSNLTMLSGGQING